MTHPSERAEARAHLAAIAQAKERLADAMAEIRTRETALLSVAIRAYNRESAELAGVVAESQGTVIGYATCEASPVWVCVYNDRVTSLPSQHRHEDEREATVRSGRAYLLTGGPCHPECEWNACLFCGRQMEEAVRQGRQVFPRRTIA